MRRLTMTLSIVLTLVLATTVFAQVRGRGRLQGNVTDKATGKPVAGATVTMVPSGQQTQPIVAKTNASGRWAALGLTSGTWNVDISAPGYETMRGTVGVSEAGQNPSVDTKLAPSVVQEAAPAAVTTTPLIPPAAVDAIKEGQELLRVKAGDVVTSTQSTAGGASTAVSHTVTANELKDNAKRAVADFEKALPLVPDEAETKTIRRQLMEVMAQAYYKAGDLPKAISTMEQLNVIDPWTTPDPAVTQRNLLLVNLYLENGDLEKGKALLEKLPAGTVTDPTVYTNIGILFLNKKNPTDALTYFGKAITLDPKTPDGYYYRGLAELQLKKTTEARADFQQVLTMAPDSQVASDAKQMLAAIPKK